MISKNYNVKNNMYCVDNYFDVCLNKMKKFDLLLIHFYFVTENSIAEPIHHRADEISVIT